MPKTTPCMNPQKGAASFESALHCQSCVSSTAAEQWALTGSITLIAAASLALLLFECQRAPHATSKTPPLQGTAQQNKLHSKPDIGASHKYQGCHLCFPYLYYLCLSSLMETVVPQQIKTNLIKSDHLQCELLNLLSLSLQTF